MGWGDRRARRMGRRSALGVPSQGGVFMIRTVMAVLLVALLTTTALANPIIGEWFYVDFDPPNYQHWVMPSPNTVVEGYLVLNLEYAWPNQVTGVSFRVDIVPWPGDEPNFETLQPSAIWEGDWREGVTIAFGDCVEAIQPVPVAKFSFFYTGGSHDVLILDHPEFPRWLLDCSDPPEIMMYCVYTNGAVGKMNHLWGDCGVNPVEAASWGSIKSMYR